jgi:SAM-dependent methyltransferase
MSGTYADVDGADDVEGAIAWQDRVDAWPEVDAYKRRSYACLPASGPVLDVGSGTAHDLLAMDRCAIGVDRSMAMCRTARARGADVARASADALPFPDRVFAGVRTDRVLAHVPDPGRALAEMVRVAGAGGRVVVADADQGSLVIHVPGVRVELVAAVRRLRRDVGYRNGTFAREIPHRLAGLGLDDISIEAFPLVLTDPDDAFGIATWVAHWRSHFTARDAEEWDAGMQQAREAGGFVYAVSYFVVSGTRP